MLRTKRIDEEFSCTEPDLEDFLVRKTLTLFRDQERLGEVLIFAHKHLPEWAYLQAELYPQELPSDIFFEKGLVRREHAFKPVQTTSSQSLQGMVLSKHSGLILPYVENHFLLREEEMPLILERLAYQQQHREEFADYVAIGSSGTGFLGYDYQPLGKKLREKIFLRKGKEADEIKKETVKNTELNEEDAVYNGELFLRKKIFDSFTISTGRTSFILQKEGQGLYLKDQQIGCLKKAVEMYQERTFSNS
ncbi:hypothetical protein HYX13_04895 [Candidatus Woesearchaeota archaeon]|nr:hypothetical protein [Candidatus Woesearchaeota archaeon]